MADRRLGEDGTRKYPHDDVIESAMERHFKTHDVTALDIANDFPIYSRPITIKRFLAHHELFMKTVDLPGDIVELGVFKGHSLFTWAKFLEVHSIGDRTKKVWGFDNFAGFGGLDGAEPEELNSALALFEQDHFVPWKNRVEFVPGDIQETVPRFVKEHPGLRISLLHFDCDYYEPTIAGLRELFPLVVPKGVVIFDEYGVMEWPGESRAVDEEFKDRYTIHKLLWSNIPGGYLIK